MNMIDKIREYVKAINAQELEKKAKQEATDFFNIELRGRVSCITFRNVIVSVNNNHADIVEVLFDLRERYYVDKINGIIK